MNRLQKKELRLALSLIEKGNDMISAVRGQLTEKMHTELLTEKAYAKLDDEACFLEHITISIEEHRSDLEKSI